jgi:hypothetical protein|tara:strand:+ start:354 stop:1376 length:1023 start_codon:yes stop_codon:yes gene_type:complete
LKIQNIHLLIAIATTLLLILALPTLDTSSGIEYRLKKESNHFLTQENFSEDPKERWILLKDAIWNNKEENFVLSSTKQGDTGVIWLKRNTTEPFTVEFSYYVGGGNGGNGFVFMFYKEGNFDPGMGRYLGFSCRPEENKPCLQKEAPGYGIEWDTLYNNGYRLGDPSPSHIALIKDSTYNHLIHVNDTSTKDNQWHKAKIVVTKVTVKVYVDQKLVLTWTGPIDRTYNRIGFSASSMVHYDWHIIDNFKMYGNTVKITGLRPGWRVEIKNFTMDPSSKNVPLSVNVLPGTNVGELDMTDIDGPLRGYFFIFDEFGNQLFQSELFDEIWGGDTLTLQSIIH